MIIDKKHLKNKFSELRSRYNGKDPYGPLLDLKEMYSVAKDYGSVDLFLEYLEEIKEDSFWRDFVKLFFVDLA